MTEQLISVKGDISASVYTQITDVERECDGFFNYDRTNKVCLPPFDSLACWGECTEEVFPVCRSTYPIYMPGC